MHHTQMDDSFCNVRKGQIARDRFCLQISHGRFLHANFYMQILVTATNFKQALQTGSASRLVCKQDLYGSAFFACRVYLQSLLAELACRICLQSLLAESACKVYLRSVDVVLRAVMPCVSSKSAREICIQKSA